MARWRGIGGNVGVGALLGRQRPCVSELAGWSWGEALVGRFAGVGGGGMRQSTLGERGEGGA